MVLAAIARTDAAAGTRDIQEEVNDICQHGPDSGMASAKRGGIRHIDHPEDDDGNCIDYPEPLSISQIAFLASRESDHIPSSPEGGMVAWLRQESRRSEKIAENRRDPEGEYYRATMLESAAARIELLERALTEANRLRDTACSALFSKGRKATDALRKAIVAFDAALTKEKG